MAAEGDNIRWYTYTGDRRVPDNVTHVIIAKSVRVIRQRAFDEHPSIIEVICDVNGKKVEKEAFYRCTSLRRLIMPGVEAVEEHAFNECEALTDVECGKLEIIGEHAFSECTSLRSINLPSAKIVEGCAFYYCPALTDVTFSSKLERIEEMAFDDCPSLERITIPLKDGMINADDSIFQGCANLNHVDLVEGPIHETIAALQLEEWRNDMNEEINSINQILPTVDAGSDEYDDEGEKTRVIRTWIRSVLGKIIHYEAEHQHLLDEVATSLQLVLPQDIVMKNVLPFLDLPSYTFGVVDEEE